MEQDNHIKRSRRKAVPAQYRRKRPVKKILIGAALFLCLLAIVAVVMLWPETETPPPVVDDSAPDTTIHLVAGGDVNITDKSVAGRYLRIVSTRRAYSTSGSTNAFFSTFPTSGRSYPTVVFFSSMLHSMPFRHFPYLFFLRHFSTYRPTTKTRCSLISRSFCRLLSRIMNR